MGKSRCRFAYTHGLATTLGQRGIRVHVIGNNRVDHVEFHTSDQITFVDLGGIRSNTSFATKLFQLAVYKLRPVDYVKFRSPKIVHILLNSKLEYSDLTLLAFCFKLLGKRVVLMAHNVNKAKRDSSDSILKRLTLKTQYRLTDQIFVHTEKMKDKLDQPTITISQLRTEASKKSDRRLGNAGRGAVEKIETW